MFSNLTQNSILYILDLNGENKIITGPIERVSLPRPKYNTFSPNMEMIVDITAMINGERREFKNVPNTSLANFESDSFVLAENRDVLNSYISSMLQNSRNIVDNIDKHKKLIDQYEEALSELNPSSRADKEKDKLIQSLQDQVNSLQEGMNKILAAVSRNGNNQNN
jgi:predicted DNA-binding protein YlxM (UPF0122 family)